MEDVAIISEDAAEVTAMKRRTSYSILILVKLDVVIR